MVTVISHDGSNRNSKSTEDQTDQYNKEDDVYTFKFGNQLGVCTATHALPGCFVLSMYVK